MPLSRQPSPLDSLALNAAAINGASPHQYAYLADEIDVSLTTALTGVLGTVGTGTIKVSYTTTADGVLWNMGAGTLDVQLATGLDLIAGRTGDGNIAIAWTNALELMAWRRGEGTIATAMTVTLNLIAGRTGEGQIPITLTAAADGSIKAHVNIEGDFLFEYITALDGQAAYAHRPDYDLSVYLDVSGSANLIEQASGTTGMAMTMDGRIRKARRVYGEGVMAMEMGVHGDALLRTLKYGQGVMSMTFDMNQSASGWPGLPVQFNAAPRWRVLEVNAEDRDMRVHARREVN